MVDTTQLPDEDTLVMPDAWRRVLYPRRGGAPGASITLNPAGAQPLLAAAKPLTLGVAGNARSDQRILAALADHQAGAASPLGAAASAAIAIWRTDLDAKTGPIADAWVHEHGLLFAVRAIAELAGLFINPGQYAAPTANWMQFAMPHKDNWHHNAEPLAQRLRRLLAVAPDEDYAAAVAELAQHRETRTQRRVAAFLVPTQVDWVTDSFVELANLQAFPRWPLSTLLCSMSAPDQLDLVDQLSYLGMYYDSVALVASTVDGLGTASAPLWARLLDEGYGDLDRFAAALALLPGDEAGTLLLDRLAHKKVRPTVPAAIQRFPNRSVRLLAEIAAKQPQGEAAALLRGHVRNHPELVTDELTASVRQTVAAVLDTAGQVPAADPADLPALLVQPPWTKVRAKTKPVVLPDIQASTEPAVRWATGERESWQTNEYTQSRRTDWTEIITNFSGGGYSWEHTAMFAKAPTERVRSLLANWHPDGWDGANRVKPVVARFELAALPPALHVARANPASAEVLLPFAHPEVATLMADWLTRLKLVRGTATRWLRRHPAAAADLLLPAALGKPGAARTAAEHALRYLHAQGHTDLIRAATARHGAVATEAIDAMLAVDPLDVLPAKVPAVPDWADPNLLPQLLLRGRTHALPPESVRHALTCLLLGKPDAPYPGVEVVRAVCDPASLAEFGWAGFLAWQRAGLPGKDSWALSALGWLGDDDTVRRFAPIIRAWPGEGGHARAVAGLDVLAAIGSDVSLTHLNGIAQKVKFKGLKTKAQEKIAEIAEARGLSPAQLADRLVPVFGLDDEGSLVLDYGPRRFVIGFDEQLKPYVADEDGTRRKGGLPKPGAKDDQELATAAYQRFAGLKKDVRTVAADQLHRLEQAMVGQRRWTAAEFDELFVRHPLLWHIVRRLVWVIDDGSAQLTGFRLAEDRTLADVNDDELTLPDTAMVGIAHPLHLGDALSDWAELFADYEILQPFPQLGRPVYRLTEAESAGGDLPRFAGHTVPTGKLLGLQRFGWERGEPLDGGVACWVSKPVPGNRVVAIELDPGIPVGAIDIFPDQKLTSIRLTNESGLGWSWHWTTTDVLSFRELDRVSASEVIAELTALTS